MLNTVAFTTLGCKVNQYDTDAMKGLFLQKGYVSVDFDEIADIYVINTCSVTGMGEKKSRQLIRQARRRNENAKIVVTGCYAQLAPEDIAAIEGVNLVIGTSNRHRVVEMVEQLENTEELISLVRNIMDESDFEEMPLYGNEIDKARAFMKIQEGCNNYCSFCIIPYTRGKLKSRKISDIRSEAERLASHGYKEIVLTGIHLGNYGAELPETERPTLADAVATIADVDGIERVRLGSIESVEVSDSLTDLIATNPVICAHLHLPLQSGCDRVLQRMNRHYNVEQFEQLVRNLRTSIPDLAITTDIIVGFPGETDEDFDTTVDTVKRIGFTHIHAFPYSKRDGTPAATMPDQVPEAVKKARVAILNELAKNGLQAYAKTQLGKFTTVLIERERNGWYEGLTDNYVHGKIKKGNRELQIGSIIGGTAVSFDDEFFTIDI